MGSASEQVHRFVERIPRVRAARGWSQQELANASGIYRQAIGKIETGDRGIGLDDAISICMALGVDLSDMLSPRRLSLTVEVPIDVD